MRTIAELHLLGRFVVVGNVQPEVSAPLNLGRSFHLKISQDEQRYHRDARMRGPARGVSLRACGRMLRWQIVRYPSQRGVVRQTPHQWTLRS